jgi:hypothetical protein
MKILSLLVLLLGLSLPLMAQVSGGCIDSTRIQFGPSCPIEINPVCGCNNITYPNLCYLNAAGVLTYTQEPCEPVYLYTYPTLVTINTITAQVFVKGPPTNLRIFIMDLYGKIFMNNLYQSLSNQTFSFFVSDLRPGMYLMVAEVNGFLSTNKIVVPEIY